MRYLISLFLFLFLVNCSLNKVSNTHGTRFIEKKYNKIILNKTNKNDVRKIIGPPSSVSDFEDTWFYIERKKISQPLVKLGKKKIDKNNILILSFNEKGLLIDKKLLNIDDMKDLKVADISTTKKFSQNNFVDGIISTLREKINAPTRNRRK